VKNITIGDLQVGWFVHVYPERVNVNASVSIEEASKLVVPIFLHVRMKPVREYCWTGPDAALIQSPIRLLQEYVGAHAIVIGIIRLSGDSLCFRQLILAVVTICNIPGSTMTM